MKTEFGYNSILFAFILLAASAISSPLVVLSFLLLILMPGYILTMLLLKNDLPLPEALILGCGVGISFIALATYAFKFLMIPLNIFTAAAILAFLPLVYVFKCGKAGGFKLKISFNKKINFATTALLIILLLGLFSRLYPIMNMNAPLFADPAVEGTMARLIVDNQGIPNT